MRVCLVRGALGEVERYDASVNSKNKCGGMARAAVSRQAADGRLCDITKWMAAVGTTLVPPAKRPTCKRTLKRNPIRALESVRCRFFPFPSFAFPRRSGKEEHMPAAGRPPEELNQRSPALNQASGENPSHLRPRPARTRAQRLCFMVERSSLFSCAPQSSITRGFAGIPMCGGMLLPLWNAAEKSCCQSAHTHSCSYIQG
ncbi:hypothetical protein Q8A67_019060 [Cirrhinus molitorella]|uniref:Uncharacterized protein n=1 Tax=Cirrhinus molitorella TaxID=172907 RepID=A0AA88PD91_9TELE|nr:hypothetical protein Q8A67_019060 [Cirrhinus molitorella]